MPKAGLFLAGGGSLDGSDVMASVLAFTALQEQGFDPVPVGRDVRQGRVVDHRTAQSLDEERNALTEAARLVRGNVRDMREAEAEAFAGAVFVGGDGVLSTWTDFHERGEDCRITERLKYQILDLYRAEKPMVCLGNAGFVLGHVLRGRDEPITVSVGSNSRLRETLESWGVRTTEQTSCWDDRNRIGCLTGATRNDTLPETLDQLNDFFSRRFAGVMDG